MRHKAIRNQLFYLTNDMQRNVYPLFTQQLYLNGRLLTYLHVLSGVYIGRRVNSVCFNRQMLFTVKRRGEAPFILPDPFLKLNFFLCPNKFACKITDHTGTKIT
jgi:hypothetical protein